MQYTRIKSCALVVYQSLPVGISLNWVSLIKYCALMHTAYKAFIMHVITSFDNTVTCCKTNTQQSVVKSITYFKSSKHNDFTLRILDRTLNILVYELWLWKILHCDGHQKDVKHVKRYINARTSITYIRQYFY